MERANARDIGFETLYGGQFTSSTQLIKPNYPALDLVGTLYEKPLAVVAGLEAQITLVLVRPPKSFNWSLNTFIR